MTPHRRRVLQAVLYEGIAVLFVAPTLAWLYDQGVGQTLLLSVLMSTVALLWNYVFNGWFERWERRQPSRERTPGRRLLHGLGFEGGLTLILVPLMAYGLNISLLEAFYADVGLLLFFFVYAVVFTWAFDKVFGLPSSVVA